MYDTALKKFRSCDNDRDPLIYYRDSLFVSEMLIHYTHSTNDVEDSSYCEVYYYEFADLKNDIGIQFKTLTDTATPIKTYLLSEASKNKIIKSPWDFYGYGKPVNPHSTAKILTDTTINDTSYKRVSTYTIFNKNNKPDTAVLISYANCNATHTMFQFDISLSKKFANGCPIQMTDYCSTNPAATTFRLKYDFTRDTLTKQEHKVLDAWEKRAKEIAAKK